MSGDGYQVDPDALKETAAGIEGAIDALKGLGLGQSGEIGRGFSGLELTGIQASSGDLKSAFDAFCERWSWGVRTLVQDGDEIATRLGLSAGLYYDQEQYVQGALKDTVNAAFGNPDQAQSVTESKSWGQVWSDNPIEDVLHPDYSAASEAKAGKTVRSTWAGEKKDLEQLGIKAAGGPVADAAIEAGHLAHGGGDE